MGEERLKFNLDEADIPAAWVNLMADLPGEALPPLTGCARLTSEPWG